MFSLKKVTRFCLARLFDGRGKVFVDFGNWSLKEILVGSKYQYCGLARSQGNGSGGLRARGQREDAVGLKLR